MLPSKFNQGPGYECCDSGNVTSEEKIRAAANGKITQDFKDISDGLGQSQASHKVRKPMDISGGHGDNNGDSSPRKDDSSDNSDNYLYKMNHKSRGKFIIINNKNFQPCTGLEERKGTDVDAANLQVLFKRLRFEVQLYHNQTVSIMSEIMQKIGAEDHSDRDCFGLAVLSHGEDGKVFGTDGCIDITKLIADIKSCDSLAGKPKLFFIQACRGCDLDDGQMVVIGGLEEDGQEKEEEDETDGKKQAFCIPIEADFLYAYSTTPGYFSWRNSLKGSWFIQALYQILSDNNLCQNLDIHRLLNRVCHVVAYEFNSNSPSHPSRHGKKQMPSIVSMLTKDLYFK